ncbi:hypothetical protein SPOG_01016 [Schizosaccharomyces cryophilus OY26]|uniref:Putative zinc-finger domain-containing protein n=1 Tax=Schizosaccharomyces cryophilus (strain OY26 / ATCC MYA-4695 / CBS 11777 / NBRC 106824 / NRRL Y48691) TaxID=653667 RepID=S9VVT0_SCHCR|nr:uncharacterized protein SPOG_01016 [Schizosaccharomyces cryophilus OY26]EPY50255.1 hypothetical protein SPOG_01016 [Schizosaccharomyces cryophilus OY26]
MSKAVDLNVLRQKALESARKQSEEESDKEDGEISEDTTESNNNVPVPPLLYPNSAPPQPPVDRFTPTNTFPFPFAPPFMLPSAFFLGSQPAPLAPSKEAQEKMKPRRSSKPNNETSFTSGRKSSLVRNKTPRIEKSLESRPIPNRKDSSSILSERHDENKVVRVETDTGLSDGLQTSSKQIEAENAINQLVGFGVKYNDFVAEGIHPSVVRSLFSKLGIELPSITVPPSAATSEKTDKPSGVKQPRKLDLSSDDSAILPGDSGTPTILPQRKRLKPSPRPIVDEWLNSSKPFGISSPHIVIELDSEDELAYENDSSSTSEVSISTDQTNSSRLDSLALLRKKEDEIRKMTEMIMKLESSKKATKTTNVKETLPSDIRKDTDQNGLSSKLTANTLDNSGAKRLTPDPESSSLSEVGGPVTVSESHNVEEEYAPWLKSVDETEISTKLQSQPAENQSLVDQKDELAKINKLIEEEENDLSKYQAIVNSKKETLTKLYFRKKEMLSKVGVELSSLLHSESTKGDVSIDKDKMQNNTNISENKLNVNGTSMESKESSPLVETIRVPPVDYISPLYRFKAFRFNSQFLEKVPAGFRSIMYSNKADPMRIMCKYETTGGVCNDEQCEAFHFRDFIMTDNEIIDELAKHNEGTDDEEKESFSKAVQDVVTKEKEKESDFNTICQAIVDTHNRWKAERLTIPIAKVSI